ncbi:hypothetical protein BG58_22790 [Caballeronia jiangsuensis]|nr:hypothetical protein BG58_22790 [Caballeronia jiangsuensis]
MATQYVVVVDATLTRTLGEDVSSVGEDPPLPPNVARIRARAPELAAGSVADVVEMPTSAKVIEVAAAALNVPVHCTSQSPAVNGRLAIFAEVDVVSDVPIVAPGVGYSPTLPVFALSFVVVPLMPFVEEGVIRPVAESVVNAPVFGAVLPIAVGFASFATT